jgi:two-component system, chemotaxis family, chemotaxis protein CheY
MAYRILIVDDSPMMRAFIKRVISMSGVDVEQILEAGDGQEALDILPTTRVDLIFTDINMPRMNGEEMVHRLAAGEATRRIPVIVVSTDGSVVRRDNLGSLGVLGYLVKPFSPEVLREEVERVVGVMNAGNAEGANAGVLNAH